MQCSKQSYRNCLFLERGGKRRKGKDKNAKNLIQKTVLYVDTKANGKMLL